MVITTYDEITVKLQPETQHVILSSVCSGIGNSERTGPIDVYIDTDVALRMVSSISKLVNPYGTSK